MMQRPSAINVIGLGGQGVQGLIKAGIDKEEKGNPSSPLGVGGGDGRIGRIGG